MKKIPVPTVSYIFRPFPFLIAGLALGYFPPQTMNAAQLAKVKNLLIQQKKHVVTYYQGSALTNLWANDEVDIVPTDITLASFAIFAANAASPLTAITPIWRNSRTGWPPLRSTRWAASAGRVSDLNTTR